MRPAGRRTDSITKAISEANRRRALQQAYDREYGIEPTMITKDSARPVLQLANLDDRDQIKAWRAQQIDQT